MAWLKARNRRWRAAALVSLGLLAVFLTGRYAVNAYMHKEVMGTWLCSYDALIIQDHVKDNNGLLPPISCVDGCMSLVHEQEYSSRREQAMLRKFIYLGYPLTNEEQAKGYLSAMKELPPAKLVKGELHCTNAQGEPCVLSQDISSMDFNLRNNTPIMLERPSRLHWNNGTLAVLFLSGCVRFIAYPGEGLVTPEFVDALMALEAQFTAQER